MKDHSLIFENLQIVPAKLSMENRKHLLDLLIFDKIVILNLVCRKQFGTIQTSGARLSRPHRRRLSAKPLAFLLSPVFIDPGDPELISNILRQ